MARLFLYFVCALRLLYIPDILEDLSSDCFLQSYKLISKLNCSFKMQSSISVLVWPVFFENLKNSFHGGILWIPFYVTTVVNLSTWEIYSKKIKLLTLLSNILQNSSQIFVISLSKCSVRHEN